MFEAYSFFLGGFFTMEAVGCTSISNSQSVFNDTGIHGVSCVVLHRDRGLNAIASPEWPFAAKYLLSNGFHLFSFKYFSQPKPYKISDFFDLSSRISFGSFDRNSVMVPQGLISVLLILANIVLDYAQESKIIPVSTQAFNACFFLLSILFKKK